MARHVLPGERPPLPWYRRWWFYLTLLVLGTTLGLVIRSALRDYQAQRDLDALIADLDQSDPNWRLEDWYRALPAVPDGENLALVALSLQRGFVSEGPKYYELFADRDLYPGNPLNPAQVKTLRDMLAGVGDLRAGADRLLKLPRGHFPPPNMDDPGFRVITHFVPGQQRLRTTVNLFDYQADLWAHDGRGDDALTACRTMLKAAHACDDDPFLISHLIGPAVRVGSVTTLERVLARTDPGEDALAALQEAYWDDSTRETFSTAVRGERACIDRFLREIQRGRYSQDEIKKLLVVPTSSRGSWFDPAEFLKRCRETVLGSPFGFIPRERLDLLQYHNEVLASLQGPEGTIEPKLKELTQQYTNRSTAAAIFAPGFVKVFGADCKARAMLRAAATLLAAERYRRTHGTLPASWDDLVPTYLPAVPTDPYDGQPLRWKKTETGLMIYSVWMNKVDDGGRIRPNDEGSARDCGVELWDAKYRGKLPVIPMPKQGEE